MDLEIGLKIKCEIEVTPQLTVPGNANKFKEFGDMPPVFATAMLVGFIEETAVKLIKPYYENNQTSLGTLVNFTHIAATPIGIKAFAEVELIKIEGKKLTFAVKCYDEYDVISEGMHERIIVDETRFMQKLAIKVPK